MQAELPRGTVTLLFSDIEGSTELARRHGAGYGDLRDEHRRLLRQVFETHGGREVDAEGDGLFVVFERATDAVAAAVAAQRALSGAEIGRVRMGVHTTEPHLRADGYVGVGVSRAARICAAAYGGQILLSRATAGIVEDDELLDVRLLDLGEHFLKDIRRPQRLFQVDADGLESDFPPTGTRAAAGTIATLLLMDLVRWRELMRELGDDRAVAAAAEYHRIVTEIVTANDGIAIERTGDRALCVFFTPKSALVAAATVRATLQRRDWIPHADKPELHAAVHTGRVASLVAGQLGSPVLRVFQLCKLAAPGQILVSHSTHALLEGEVLGGLGLRDLGERELPELPRSGKQDSDPTAQSRVYELVS